MLFIRFLLLVKFSFQVESISFIKKRKIVGENVENNIYMTSLIFNNIVINISPNNNIIDIKK